MSQQNVYRNRNFKSLCISTSLAVFCIFNQNVGWAAGVVDELEIKYESLPSVTAVLHKYSSQSPDVVSEAWVSLSPQGIRVTDLTTQSEIIKNFVSNKVWLINRRHKTQHEVDVVEFKKLFPNLVEYLIGPETQSNILGRSPCVDWDKKLNGERVWRGQIVEDWSCLEESGVVVSKQMYSNRLGIVVRVQHPNTTIEELRDIKEQLIDIAVFQKENDFKSVNIDEFFDDTSRLATFKEQ